MVNHKIEKLNDECLTILFEAFTILSSGIVDIKENQLSEKEVFIKDAMFLFSKKNGYFKFQPDVYISSIEIIKEFCNEFENYSLFAIYSAFQYSIVEYQGRNMEDVFICNEIKLNFISRYLFALDCMRKSAHANFN
jgi:hypothetical protein